MSRTRVMSPIYTLVLAHLGVSLGSIGCKVVRFKAKLLLVAFWRATHIYFYFVALFRKFSRKSWSAWMTPLDSSSRVLQNGLLERRKRTNGSPVAKERSHCAKAGKSRDPSSRPAPSIAKTRQRRQTGLCFRGQTRDPSLADGFCSRPANGPAPSWLCGPINTPSPSFLHS